jgi:hypothetical protein
MDFVSHLDIPDEAKAMLIVASIDAISQAAKLWTESELAILRRHYPGGGAVAVREHLPHRTPGAVHEKAKRLGLKVGPTRNHLLRYSNSVHIDEAIRRFYLVPHKGGLSKLANQLNRPRHWISARARYLAVTIPRRHDGPWSEAEIALLRKNAAKVPYNITRIFAKHGFRRSASAIKNKMLKLRCVRDDEDMYSASGVAELFGVDVHLVINWIRKGWLKAQMKGTARERDTYQVHHNHIRRFVIENVGAIDIRRVEKDWFVDLLAGRE